MNDDTDPSPFRKRIWQVFWILFALEAIGLIAWFKFVERRAYPFQEAFVLDRDRVEERHLSWLAWGHYGFELTDSSGPPFIAHSGSLAVELVSESGEMVLPRTSDRFEALDFRTGLFERYTMRVTIAKGFGGPPRTVELRLIGSDAGCAGGLEWVALGVVLAIVLAANSIALAILLWIFDGNVTVRSFRSSRAAHP